MTIRILQLGLFIGLFSLLFSSCNVQKKQGQNRNATAKLSAPKRGKAVDRRVVSHYADLLKVNENSLNADLFHFIDEWMGMPHRLGGMTRDGIDCSGFVMLAYRDVYQKDLPRTSRDMAENVIRKYDHQLKEGDLVFFSFGGRAVDHVGIYLHNDRFVHVSTKAGVIISNLKDPWYYKYLTRCGTPKV